MSVSPPSSTHTFSSSPNVDHHSVSSVPTTLITLYTPAGDEYCGMILIHYLIETIQIGRV